MRVLACLAALLIATFAAPVIADDAVPPSALVARRTYLAKAADCAGCHTAQPDDGKPQPRPFAGDIALGSPFGKIWSSNITPDPQHGIGRYRYEDFARALREDVTPDGKHLYPAMPYPSFSKIDDNDMHALYAYFMQAVEPVNQAAPETRLPFPFDQRWALAFWNFAFAPSEPFSPGPKRDAQWNRGAYLVQSLGHCGACHTPRGPAYNERGYDESSKTYLTSGTNDHWYAPNLTSLEGAGLGRVSAAGIASFLKTGHGNGLVPFGSMIEVVEDSTQYMNEQDLALIAAYLKSLPANGSGGDPQSPAAKQSLAALQTGEVERPGAGLQANCARYHRSDGAGVTMKFPRLAGNPAVLADQPESLVRLLLESGHALSTDYGPPPKQMPAFGKKLTDTEIVRVLTFVRSAWGNDAPAVTTRDVERVRKALAKP